MFIICLHVQSLSYTWRAQFVTFAVVVVIIGIGVGIGMSVSLGETREKPVIVPTLVVDWCSYLPERVLGVRGVRM